MKRNFLRCKSAEVSLEVSLDGLTETEREMA